MGIVPDFTPTVTYLSLHFRSLQRFSHLILFSAILLLRESVAIVVIDISLTFHCRDMCCSTARNEYFFSIHYPDTFPIVADKGCVRLYCFSPTFRLVPGLHRSHFWLERDESLVALDRFPDITMNDELKKKRSK